MRLWFCQHILCHCWKLKEKELRCTRYSEHIHGFASSQDNLSRWVYSPTLQIRKLRLRMVKSLPQDRSIRHHPEVHNTLHSRDQIGFGNSKLCQTNLISSPVIEWRASSARGDKELSSILISGKLLVLSYMTLSSTWQGNTVCSSIPGGGQPAWGLVPTSTPVGTGLPFRHQPVRAFVQGAPLGAHTLKTRRGLDADMHACVGRDLCAQGHTDTQMYLQTCTCHPKIDLPSHYTFPHVCGYVWKFLILFYQSISLALCHSHTVLTTIAL